MAYGIHTTNNLDHATTAGTRAATSTVGYRANATTAGPWADATTAGNLANATTVGNWANATTAGEGSIAAALGSNSKARAGIGGAIVIVCRDDDGEILHVFASKVGENGIKPGKWYELWDDGMPNEVAE